MRMLQVMVSHPAQPYVPEMMFMKAWCRYGFMLYHAVKPSIR